MKTTVIRSSWLSGYGHRLDTKPYVGGALETKVLLERLPLTKQLVRDLVLSNYGGIYFAGREGVTWVDSPEYGIPFLRGKDIQLADLSESPFISKRQVETNPTFLIRKGMTLITRSGTIGKTAYVRADMDGMATSDPLRVVPDPNKIPSGYLYAYLSSKFGVPLLASGAYGAIIQHLEPSDIASIPVPRLGDAIEHEIHTLVEQAAELRTQCNKGLRAVSAKFDALISNLPLRRCRTWMGEIPSGRVKRRMDVGYFDPNAWAVREQLSQGNHKTMEAFCQSIRLPGIFKRIHTDDPTQGAAYFTGAALYCLDPEPKGYLSPRTSLYDDVLIKRGMILVQAFGSEGGLNGRPVWVGKHLDGATTTHMLVRLTPGDLSLSGYLFAFLRSNAGYQQISALPFGGAIPNFDEAAIGEVIVPLFDDATSRQMSKEAESALAQRDQAFDNDLKARSLVENAIEESSK